MTTEPSPYEQQAWDDLTRPRPRRLASRAAGAVGDKITGLAETVAGATGDLVESRPRLSGARDRAVAAGGAVRDRLPDGLVEAPGLVVRKVAEGGARAVSRVATVALSPKRVVKAHAKAGHPVSKLTDLRALDLELIDDVKPRSLDVAYAAAAAASGGFSGFMITGSQLAVPVSGGVAAAPSMGMIAGAFTADAMAVTGLASAVVGHHAMHYGYDPTRAEEKVFLLSVVNAGTAVTAGAKASAFADVSRLTQLLVRGATWEKLNQSVLTKVAAAFAKAFEQRLIKQGLGKAVPAAGILAGATLNWLTLEQIADTADVAYRRRFLLEKYPHLWATTGEEPAWPTDEIVIDTDADEDEDEDEEIAVVDLLRDEGVVVDPDPTDAASLVAEPTAP